MPPRFPLRLLAAGALLLLSPVFAGAAQSPVKTSAQILPLILKGKDVAPFLGVNLLGLSAFSCAEGRVKPLLFQADEINAEGRYVSVDSEGRLAKDTAPGILDENDELAFMLRDLGEPCPPAVLAEARGRLLAVQVQPAYAPKAVSLYLLAGETRFVPAGAHVQYSPASQIVSTAAYEWGYEPGQPFLYKRNVFHDLEGRSQEDILDRLKVRFNVRAMKSLIRLRLSEEDFKSRLAGVRTGPIRIVRELDLEVTPVPGMTLHPVVTFTNYERLWHAHVRFKFPAPAALFTTSMDVSLIHDFTDLRGLRFSTSALPQGTIVDGRMIEQDRSIAFGPEPWYMVTGGGLNYLVAIDLEKNLDLTAAATFDDTAVSSDPPEEVPGALPAIGYQFLGWENLEARWYGFSANIALLPRFPEGGGSGFYRTLHAPVKIQAEEIKSAAP